ncbi:MAG TPA: response regulator transcription factor [Acidobacteriaceae bacterium]|nr:response regulator transcription factor [Acidobacteriaceae bacterium]
MRLLVAEDDEALGMYLKRALEADGNEVHLTADGKAAVELFLVDAPEFAILDLNLPRMDGTEVLKQVRVVSEEVPVLILTARKDIETRLLCLDLGADDCMMKPFALAELRARVRVLARRRRELSLMLRQDSLEVNRVEHKVHCGGREVSLTGKEFALLEHLLLNRGRAVTRATLLEQVWKMPAEAGTNVVDVYVNYLRRKLGEPAAALIQTVRGQGYAIGLRA